MHLRLRFAAGVIATVHGDVNGRGFFPPEVASSSSSFFFNREKVAGPVPPHCVLYISLRGALAFNALISAGKFRREGAAC